MLYIDALCYRSRLLSIQPHVKVLFGTMALLICLLSQKQTVALAAIASIGGFTVLVGGIPFAIYCKLLQAPLLFILMSSIPLMLQVSRVPDAHALFCIPLGSVSVGLDLNGILRAIQLSLTACASISCLYFIILSTPLTDVLLVLQWLKCPSLIVSLMLLIYRFIFIVIELAYVMNVSRKARLGDRTKKRAILSLSILLTTLFQKAFYKTGAFYDAMEARCYRGSIAVLTPPHYLPKKALLIGIGYQLFLCALWLFA